MGTYIVVLGPPAQRLIESLHDHGRRGLEEALRTELEDGPNSYKELTLAGGNQAWLDAHQLNGADYTATPLSFDAFTAVHRPLTKEELRQFTRAKPVADTGFYVVDILPAESAFSYRIPRG